MAAWQFENAKIEYDALGYDPVPLLPNTKDAWLTDWPNRTSADLWQHAPADSNIGIRAGGMLRVAIIDTDDWKDTRTSQNVTRYLAGMGIDAGDYPLVESAGRGGKHFYLRLIGDSLADHKRNLASDFGAGHFAYGSGAQCVAPPSEIDGRAYRLIGGDWRQLPRVEVADVLPLLANQDTTPELPKPTISRRAWALLEGKGIDRYPTHSEAEQAIIASLVNTGHDFSSVLFLFTRYPCAGKFNEIYAKHPQRAIKWLQLSFAEAQKWTQTHESKGRHIAQAAIAWAEARAWQGRTGMVDRAVFTAHATLAHNAGRITYAASCRDLAELARVTHVTATNATRRLVGEKLLSLEIPATPSCANVYKLAEQQTFTLPNYSIVRECKGLRLTAHDAFRPRGYGKTFRARGLGKSAGEVWAQLQDGKSLTIAELAERTGRHKDTIERALERMARIVDMQTGVIIRIVELNGDKWRACEGIDLDEVARAVGTYGASDRQRRQHADERRRHRAQLELGKAQHNKKMLRRPSGACE